MRGDLGPGDRPRRPWPLILGAALALVIAMGVAFAIGMHGRGDDDADRVAAPVGGTDAPAARRRPTSADEPTEAGMVDFVQTYIETASSDPAAAFDMLTPSFQEQSHGLTGYEGFWGDVRTAKLLDVSADPASLEVSYTYRYVKPPAGPTEDDVVLKLTYENGTLPHRPGAVSPLPSFTPEGEVFGGRFGVKCA